MALSGVSPLTRFAALNQSPVQARKKWDQAALQQLCREPSSDTAAECHSIEDLNCCLIQVLQRCLPPPAKQSRLAPWQTPSMRDGIRVTWQHYRGWRQAASRIDGMPYLSLV